MWHFLAHRSTVSLAPNPEMLTLCIHLVNGMMLTLGYHFAVVVVVVVDVVVVVYSLNFKNIKHFLCISFMVLMGLVTQ